MEIKKFGDIIREDVDFDPQKKFFMDEAIRIALENVKYNGGGPFGAVIVKNNQIIGMGVNKVTIKNDPTAHAEIEAIRVACNKLGSFQLTDCEIYTTCFPCAMCCGSIYWARPKIVYYALNQYDAANIGFDDDFIYKELNKPPETRKIPLIEFMRDDAHVIFDEWKSKLDKTEY